MLGESGEGRALEILVGSDVERAAWFSPRYGIRTASRALRTQFQFVGQASLFTCISTSNEIPLTITGQEGAVRVTIQRGEQTESLFYCVQHDRSMEGEGVRFDGELLYFRKDGDRAPAVWANRFRGFSLAGVLEVSSLALIESLLLDDERCEMVLAADHSGDLEVSARKGVWFLINGQPARIGAKTIS